MSISVDSLLTVPTRAQVKAKILDWLSLVGFPLTAWQATSAVRLLVEGFAGALLELWALVVAIARGGYLSTAAGAWLTVLAADLFGVSRLNATPTVGTVTLVESAGSPQSWAAGALVVVHGSTGRVYRNVAAVSLGALGSVAFSIAADEPGASYNVDGSGLVLGTPVPGVALSAAAATAWISSQGTDEESDELLRARCLARWDSLSAAGAAGVYVWAVTTKVPGITRVRVQEDPGAVYPSPAVTVIVAGPDGPAGSADLVSAGAVVQVARPLGLYVTTSNAGTYAADIRGLVYVRAAYVASAPGAIEDAVRAYVRTLGIGAALEVAELIRVIMNVPGVENVKLTDGAGVELRPVTDDWLPAADAVPALTFGGLSMVSV